VLSAFAHVYLLRLGAFGTPVSIAGRLLPSIVNAATQNHGRTRATEPKDWEDRARTQKEKVR